MLESMWAEIGDEKTWAAFVKKFAGGDSVSSWLASAPKEATISQKFTAETLQKAESALAQVHRHHCCDPCSRRRAARRLKRRLAALRRGCSCALRPRRSCRSGPHPRQSHRPRSH